MMSSTSPIVRAARWSATHPWRAIGLWAALVAVALALTSTVATKQATDADFRVGESGRAAAMIDRAGLEASPTESVLITARHGTLDTTQAETAATQLAAAATDLRGVAGVGTPVWSPSRDAVLVPITMRGTAQDAEEHLEALIDATAAVQRSHPGLDVEQAGEASLNAGINDKVGDDLAAGEALSLPVTFVILLIAFGALIAAGIPVLLAATSVLTSLGLYAPISQLAPDSGSVANVVLLIGMAVGVDYSLFYLKRQREERQRGRSTIDAIEVAAATSGHAVVVSGLAVVVAMSGLFLSGDTVFSSLAIGSIIVVVVAVIGSLTVLPALLAVLGHWVDRPRVPLLWRLNQRIGAGGIAGRLIRPVIRRPGASALIAGGLLVALAAPALGMKTHQSTIDTLPQDIPAVHAYQRMQQSFPSERPTIQVVTHANDRVGGEAARKALEDVEHTAIAARLATPAERSITVSQDGRTIALSMHAAYAEGDPRNDTAIEQLRGTVVPRAADVLDPSTTAVGGTVAEDYDHEHRRSMLPWVIAFVLVLTLAMMGWTFRSLRIALLTTVLNLLSVGAAFGVLTVVFQHDWFDGLLGYQSSGYVVDWIPLFCFVVLVGLSMDYHVFVLSRVREGLRQGLPYDRAIELGIRETASVVTSAAAVMVSVFAVFATLSMLEMKQMGVGLSVAILLDATLVRLALLPALLLKLRAWPARLAERDDPFTTGPLGQPETSHSAVGVR